MIRLNEKKIFFQIRIIIILIIHTFSHSKRLFVLIRRLQNHFLFFASGSIRGRIVFVIKPHYLELNSSVLRDNANFLLAA